MLGKGRMLRHLAEAFRRGVTVEHRKVGVEDGDAGAVLLCHVDRAAYGHVAGFENPEVPACSPAGGRAPVCSM